MSTPEGKVKKATRELLERHGALVYMPVPGRFGSKAVDMLCCVYGLFVAIETKAQRGMDPTNLQSSFLRQVRDAGGRTFVIRAEDDLGELATWLDDMRAGGVP